MHLRPPPASPQSQSQFKLRSVDSGTQLQLLVQQRMLQQKRNLFHRHRSGGSPTPLAGSANSSISSSSVRLSGSVGGDHLARQDSYKLAQRAQIVPLLPAGPSPHHSPAIGPHHHQSVMSGQSHHLHHHNHHHHHLLEDEFMGGGSSRERDEERWKSLPSRLAADCQLAERTLLWSQQVTS